jgi:hypothetical protein
MLHISRNSYMIALVPILSKAQHIILKLTVKPSE